ncbi:conserved exported hypothetical protein [Desulfamplus magnetovallimortis]|uniref:Uncharacterized protein n=1 Tax=Desulfamplus magnetovallimortis TaxID=1246637 RepID=A0A1W1HJE5_9BACT|nr:hypothetical protein [Desulfamplus magnetovallimortis]SLM32573.1 conserved exported hypothetical protein [Desulfamplus magnetovallimortis]
MDDIVKKLLNSISFMLILTLCHANTTAAFEVAPRITDREIVEALTEVKHGQQALNKRMDDMIINFNKRFEEMNANFNKRFEEMNANFNKRFESVDKRFEDINRRFDDINQRFEDINRRFEDINLRFEDMNKRFEDMNKRFDNMHNTMLTLYASTMALIGGLIGYMIWDRKKSTLPLKRKLDQIADAILTVNQTTENLSTLHAELEQHLELRNPSGPVVPRLLKALKELAHTDEKLANVLRSFSLL